jgi:hypothetical protein
MIALTIVNLLALVLTWIQLRPAAANSVAPVLRGSALEIVDEQGQVRAQIKIEPASTNDGKKYPESAVFRLKDPEGRIRVKLAADQDGSGLVLTDDSQQPGVHVLAKGSGSSVKVVNKSGKEVVVKP